VTVAESELVESCAAVWMSQRDGNGCVSVVVLAAVNELVCVPQCG